MKNKNLEISFVVPLFNEAGNIAALCEEIMAVMTQSGKTYEIIFVNDGSTDLTQSEIEKLHGENPTLIKGIQFRTQSGKASALQAGFEMSKGKIIFTMDGDLQDDPNEIPRFLDKIREGYDLVSGWKSNRKDSFIKNNTSKIFNYFTNLISNVKLHDFNCGFKAYKAEALKDVYLYGQLHRYIPVLVSHQGFSVAEIPVNHRKRLTGKSKYGPIRFLHGFLDLFTVLFITRFKQRPLHLFGYLGMIFFSIGFLVAGYLSLVKIFGHESIGERPLLLFAVMLMIMGVQIGITGLISEQLANISNKNNIQYLIRKILVYEK